MTTEILGGALALSLATGAYLKIDNANLEKDLITARYDLSISEHNNSILNKAIGKQNSAIESIRVDYAAKMTEYNNTKPKIVEIIKYKYRDINITRGNCDDVKDFADALSGISI